MANYLLKLFDTKHGRASERTNLGELPVDAGDDEAAIKRLKESYPDRLSECDCAELYRPDGKLVWEMHGDSEV
ncbi:MAG TPA: hypothetical protein VHZ26_10445 [Caulobacteraceae bacterium]|jgi:hypothetical protein|nr:hypothetical protein [Caulobacteraceae bacterium]